MKNTPGCHHLDPHCGSSSFIPFRFCIVSANVNTTERQIMSLCHYENTLTHTRTPQDHLKRPWVPPRVHWPYLEDARLRDAPITTISNLNGLKRRFLSCSCYTSITWQWEALFLTVPGSRLAVNTTIPEGKRTLQGLTMVIICSTAQMTVGLLTIHWSELVTCSHPARRGHKCKNLPCTQKQQ